MKIKTVTFRRLVSGPGFSNTAIEATAEVEPAETAELAFGRLCAWVAEQHGLERQIGDRWYELSLLRDNIKSVKEQVDHEQKQIEWYRERRMKVEDALIAAKKAGAIIDPEIVEYLNDDIPF